jgi:hypothetical protein
LAGSFFGAVSAFVVAEGAGSFLPATLADVGGSGIADAEGITEAIGAISVEADGIGDADVSTLALWGGWLDGAVGARFDESCSQPATTSNESAKMRRFCMVCRVLPKLVERKRSIMRRQRGPW